MACLAALLFALAGPGIDENSPTAARVVVECGTVRVSDAHGVPIEVARRAEREVEGAGRMSISGASKAALRWSSRASVELVGPASCAWSYADGGELYCRLEHFGEAYVELRGGALTLEAPGGWHAHLEPGVAVFTTRASGAFEVALYAGTRLSLERVGDDPSRCARVTLAPGESRVLDVVGATASSDSRSVDVERARARWIGFAWPWSSNFQPFDPNEASEPVLLRAPLSAPHSAPKFAPPTDELAPKDESEPAPIRGLGIPIPTAWILERDVRCANECSSAISSEVPPPETLALIEMALEFDALSIERMWRSLGVPSSAPNIAMRPIRREGTLIETRWGARWSDLAPSRGDR